MQWKNVLVVYRKELMDMLRDRRTIFSMLVFPVVLFPLLTVGFGRFEQRMRAKATAEPASVMVLGAEHAPRLAEKLRDAEGLRIVATAPGHEQQISDKRLRAAVEIPPGFEAALAAGAMPSAKIQIYFYLSEIRSQAAARRLEEVLRSYRDEVVQGRLAARNVPAAVMRPLEAKRENVASEEKVSGLRLGVLVPYFIIFLCLTGAMHPGMDLTAGEKERGTMETILASAVRRDELVLGKFLLVFTASMITAVMAISSFTVTTRLAGGISRGGAVLQFTVGPKALAAVFLLVLPLAVMFAGSVMAISLFAKSYKEAQSYLSSVMLLVILPAMVGMLPGVDLNTKLALVPILNVSLAAKEILTGNYLWGPMAMVLLSSFAFAGAALYAAVHLFQREEVLFRT